MKWWGMSGVGAQEQLIRVPLLARGTCILLVVVVATWAHPHHSHPHQHHFLQQPQHRPLLRASTTKLRPERAALTPPTVTSLRPPDRSRNGHHVVGVIVPGDQSGSNSPPVVASLSPSSTTYPRDPPDHSSQQFAHRHLPTAPLATAASGSRVKVSLSEHHSPVDHHHTVSAPTAKSISSSSLQGTRTFASTPSSWDTHIPTHRDVSSTRGLPKHARISSRRVVPEPMEDNYTPVQVTSEGEGSWTQRDTTVGDGWTQRDTAARGGWTHEDTAAEHSWTHRDTAAEGSWTQRDTPAGGGWTQRDTTVGDGWTQRDTAAIGGWTHEDTAAEEGLWAEEDTVGWDSVNHRPHISRGRPDTFGYDITEDLTHLSGEYSPRKSQGGAADQIFSSSSVTIHPPSEGSHGGTYHFPASSEDELNAEGLKETEMTDNEQKRKRKRKKGQKDRRGRKNRGKKKKGQRSRKGQQQAIPDLVYTTVILPVDSSERGNETVMTQFPTPTQIPVATDKSTVPLTSKVESAETPLTTQPPILTAKPLLPHTTISTPSPNFPQRPTNSPSSTTLSTTLFITPAMPKGKTPSPTRTMLPPKTGGPQTDSQTTQPTGKTTKASIVDFTVMKVAPGHKGRETDAETVPEYHKPISRRPDHHEPHLDLHRQHKERRRPPKVVYKPPKHTENEVEGRTNFVRGQQKDDYIFPIKGILIISGVMGALAVFTLVVLISYAVIKCSKKPAVNNYQVSEQKPVTQ